MYDRCLILNPEGPQNGTWTAKACKTMAFRATLEVWAIILHTVGVQIGPPSSVVKLLFLVCLGGLGPPEVRTASKHSWHGVAYPI